MVRQRKMATSIRRTIFKKVCKSKPIFQKGKEKPTYAEAVNSKQKKNIIIKKDQLMIMFKMYNIMKEAIHQMTTEIHKHLEDIINIRTGNKKEALRQNHL